MKKLLISLIVIGLVSGCSAKNESDDLINRALAMPPVTGTNHSKGFLKYYLNPDMGIKASTQTSSLLMIDNTEVMMSINVSEILSNFYKDDKEKEIMLTEMAVEENGSETRIEGMYLDQGDKQRSYTYLERDVGEHVAITLSNGLVTLVTLVYPGQKNMMIPSLVSILRSTQVSEDLVVAQFSNKEVIHFDTIHKEFFEQEIPESGSLIDMYNQMNPDDKIE